MKAFTILTALLGTALAAPRGYTPVQPIQKSVENKYTTVKESSKVVVEEKNTLNGTATNSRNGGSRVFSINSNKVSTQAVQQSIPLKLVNNLDGDAVNCYISGLDSDGKVVFLGSAGNLIYPSAGGSEVPVTIAEDIAIPMPAKGQTFEITLPIAMASGRVYFAQGELEFFMVKTATGDGLVQPSNTNLEDPSRNINWGFVELTLTTDGVIWANISYVDFVGLIMSMTLRTKDNNTQEVIGLPGNAVTTVCEKLLAQGEKDGLPWGAMCIAGTDGKPLRVLSPEDYGDVAGEGWEDYWTEYVDKVWAKYSTETLSIKTQAVGDVACKVVDNKLTCEGDNRAYPKPDHLDIWGCNSGPFGIQAEDNAVHVAVVPRLCAAFVRSTLLLDGGNITPDLPDTSYYTVSPTSHYSRIIHEEEVDGRGYAFPYDDVNPTGSEDAAGLVSSGNYESLTFYIGGKQ
ncbi:unnamed protein product [Clonostachys byssicola]|uniref:GH64 domain-containing protein n=1 Tax=Clonostachys byssicola TaxID=160290 RepID=A0A9N9UQ15_9HYPO|nr:unnamed protein product [Clonostachys byssicola]